MKLVIEKYPVISLEREMIVKSRGMTCRTAVGAWRASWSNYAQYFELHM